MPTPSTRLAIPLPAANEADTRANYIAALQAIDDVAALDSQTVNPAIAAPAGGNTLALSNMLSWIVKTLLAITGAASWFTSPAYSLAKIKAILDGIDATKIPNAALAAGACTGAALGSDVITTGGGQTISGTLKVTGVINSAFYQKGSGLAAGATWSNVVQLPNGYACIATVWGAPSVGHFRTTAVLHFYDSANKGVVELLETSYGGGCTISIDNNGWVSITSNSTGAVADVTLSLIKLA